MPINLTAPVNVYRPGIPGAPVDMAVNSTQQAMFTVICAAPAAFCVALALKMLIKDRDLTWLIFLVGGTVGMFVEPILDYMGGVWWPVHGSWEAFNLVGINIPLLVCFVYPWLLGGQAYLTYRLFERGMTPRKLWYLVGIFAINDVVLETIGVKVLRVYAYFGQQPLNLWGLPLWYVPCNAIGPVVAGALFYLLRDRLAGWRIGGAIALLPMSFVGVYAVCGFPVWIALNSGWGALAATACGVAVFGLAYLMVGITSAMTGMVSSQPSRDDLTARRLSN